MKKTYLFAMVAVVASVLVSCQSDVSPRTSSTKLWPAAFVIPTDQTTKYGYINENGLMTIPANYQETYAFSCGYGLVRVSEASFFFINEKGDIQAAPSFDEIGTYFYYDHVRYKTSNLWGLLNKSFDVAIQPAYYSLGNMTDAGLVRFKQASDSKFGYLDKNANTAIAPIFDVAYDFEGDNAVVQMGDTYGVINKSGDFTIGLQSRPLGSLGANRIGFYDKDSKKYGMMDVNGNYILQAIYDDYSDYGFTSSDIMAVELDDKWGYIDNNGNMIIPVQFAAASPFSEDIAWIKRAQDSNYEAIDKNGKTLLTLGKDEWPAGMFRRGLCMVQRVGQNQQSGDMIREYKYINEKGKTIYTWSYNDDNYPAPAKDKNVRSMDIDKMMAPTKWGYRATK